MTEKKSRADDMRKSRANATLIQVRLTPENIKSIELAKQTTTVTSFVNELIVNACRANDWVKHHIDAVFRGDDDFEFFDLKSKQMYVAGVVSCALVCGVITLDEANELRDRIHSS